jgi:BolA protein
VSERARLIEQRLRAELDAIEVSVIDNSARHAGHLAAEDGAGHFQVLVVSPRFEGLSRIAAQRLVYQAVADLMNRQIHALEMRTLTPEAWRRMVASR